MQRLARVVMVMLQSEEQGEDYQAGASDKRKEAGERGDAQEAGTGEDERHAMVEYALTALNEELVTELLEGCHFENSGGA